METTSRSLDTTRTSFGRRAARGGAPCAKSRAGSAEARGASKRQGGRPEASHMKRARGMRNT
eukprot:8752760-Alexandrium_andersonii.AAC.1